MIPSHLLSLSLPLSPGASMAARVPIRLYTPSARVLACPSPPTRRCLMHAHTHSLTAYARTHGVALCLQVPALNKFLQEQMEGLTAKVFRTYNASITLQEELKKLTPTLTDANGTWARSRSPFSTACPTLHAQW